MAEWGDRGGFRASPHKFTAETPRSYFKCIEVLNYFDHFDSEETDAGMVVAAFFLAVVALKLLAWVPTHQR